jgi:Zn-dependent protease with chaperone function
MRAPLRHAAALLLCTLLGACASSPHNDRAQLAAPLAVSKVYSSANLQLMLAVSPSGPACDELDCLLRADFDQRVAQAGARLSEAAYRSHPDLAACVPAFEFLVADKADAGTASSAAGEIVILRPVGALALSDEALAFVMAREMGHVIGRHHEENTGFSLMTSIVTTLLAPAINVAKLLASVSSGATAVSASAALTAGSFAGSRMLIESYRPRQREEADEIALALMRELGYLPGKVLAGFSGTAMPDSPIRWVRDLRMTIDQLRAQAEFADADVPEQTGHRVARLSAPAGD